MRTAKIFLFVTLLALPAMASSQNKPVSITNADYIVEQSYTTENGLPANGVNELYQDRKGYLWAATYNGLVRYDGVNFTVFNANNLSELDSNRFMDVTEDLNGNIWAGLEYSNVVQITEDTSYVYQINAAEAGANISINSIIHTGPNQYWMGTTAGLFFFDGVRFSYRDDLPRESVQRLTYQDGKLFVLFARHLYSLNSDGTEEKLHFQIQDGVLSSSSGYEIEEFRDFKMLRSVLIFEDYFLLTAESGIVKLSEHGHEFLLKREEIGLTTIHGLVWHKGVYFVFGANGVYRLSSLEEGSIKAEKYSESRVINLFFDKEDTIWLATTASGIHKIIETPVYQGDRYGALDNVAVTAVFEGRNGDLWAGSNCDYLYQFSKDGHKVYGAAEGIVNSCVWSVTETSDGTIWIGTWGDGAFFKPPGEAKFRAFRPDAMETADAVLSIYEDSKGDIWFGTYYSGVFRFNGEETVSISGHDGEEISATRMIFEDSEGDLLFATDNGIGFYDGDFIRKLEVFNRLDTQNFRVINKDPAGRFWFGSYGGGILIYEPGGIIRTITTDNGLLDDTVSQIEFDRHSNVWLAGNLGVFFIEKEELDLFFNGLNRDLRISRLGVAEGLPIRETTGGFMPSSLLNSRDELFIPTVQGLAMLNVDKMELNRDLPNVLLEDVEVNGVRIPADQLRTISHNAQRIIFSFAALSFKNPEYVQFEYKLDGLDSDWRRLVNSREAIYTTLPVGEYTLRVRASNSHGFWNEEGAFVSFSVTPPFWQTSWFFLFMAMLLVLGVFAVISYRIRNIRKYNIQLQKKVDERTAELRVSNQELKKMVDEKNKLHSILAHDLRNPFTSIMGYIDLLRQTYKDEGDKENQEMMELLLDSGKNTLNLLENLLQWSGNKGNGLDPDMEPTNITLLAEEAIKMTEAQASFKNVEVCFTNKEPVYAVADRNMILSVIRNLISNAIKFSGARSQIILDIAERADDVLVSVKDEGVGMTEGESNALFSGHNLQNKLGTQGEKGVGMGLQICKDFVEVHGGKIWVNSRPGGGSTFYFTLQKVSEEVL
jgi:signal transduction histidine kinase/streptogramin lyase